MMLKKIIVIISALLLFSASIILAISLSGKTIEPIPRIKVAGSISEKQPEPTGDYGAEFVAQYVAEHKTVEKLETDETTIPCFRENDLLFESLGCFSLGKDAGRDFNHSSQMDFFERMILMFPNPLVRETEDYYYLVYHTDNDTRLFLFYSKEKTEGLFLDGYPIIMKEALSYKDFSGIQIGDSIEKVNGIDSIIPLCIKRFEMRTETNYEKDKASGIYFTSIHLLSDGILQIEYDRKDSDYVVIDITYNDDFVLEGVRGNTCYKIFEMDYVE